jgi:hypothetical protein
LAKCSPRALLATSHYDGLAIYIKKSIILRRQKKNYGNSNISPCKNIINLQKKKKSSKKNPKSFKILL